MLMPEKLYTAGEVARIFGVSYVAVKKWAYSERIYGARSHKKRMIVAAVEDAVRDC
jgi:predicted site-specific integrase-resolvase